MLPNGKGQAAMGAGDFNGKGLKGGVHPPQQPSAALSFGGQQAVTQGAVPVGPEPTSGVLSLVTQQKFQKPQGKGYKALIPQATPAPGLPEAMEGQRFAMSGSLVPQSHPAPEPAVLPQGKYKYLNLKLHAVYRAGKPFHS